MPLVLAQPILPPRISFYSRETLLAYTVTTPPVHSYNTVPLNQLYPYYTARMNTRWIHPQYTARIHSHCNTSTQPQYTVTAPPVHSQNTQSLYHQYTATIHSHCTTSTQLKYSHCTTITQPEYTVTVPPVNSLNTQSLYHQYTARIHSHCTTSTQLEYTVTVPPVHS